MKNTHTQTNKQTNKGTNERTNKQKNKIINLSGGVAALAGNSLLGRRIMRTDELPGPKKNRGGGVEQEKSPNWASKNGEIEIIISGHNLWQPW